MARFNQSARKLLIISLLGAVTLALFSPVRWHGFIRYDDPDYVVANPRVATGLSWTNLGWAFSSGYASNWHPLTWISHMLDVELFGLKAGWHHLTNVLLHLLNTCLLFLWLEKLTGRMWRSALVAALFAWHPLHVESVAWVAERKDVLSAFFFMLMLVAYAAYGQTVQSPKSKVQRAGSGGEPSGTQQATHNTGDSPGSRRHASGWYTAALVLFTLGLMSKPMLVGAPLVLVLVDLWPLRRLEEPGSVRRCVLEKVPFVCLAAASSIVTFLVQERSHSVTLSLPFACRIANALASYVKYLGKTIWPSELAVFYPHPDARYPISHQWPWWGIVVAGLALLGVSHYAARSWRRAPWLTTGWFWFLGMLVPVIGLVQAGSQAMADRYTYLPLIGIFICGVWGVAEVAGLQVEGCRLQVGEAPDEQPTRPNLQPATWKLPLLGVCVLCALALGACLALTHRQLGYWRNNLTLFEHALAVTRDNAVAHCHVGIDYGEHGRYQVALEQFRAAAEADPNLADAHYGLGYTLQLLGKPQEAEQEYQTALRLRPWQSLVHSRLAELKYTQGNVAEALELFAAELRVNPGNTEARLNMGGILWQQGRRDEALAQYGEAVRLNPGNAMARFNLGVGLAAQQRSGEAAQQFAEAVRLQPTYPEALSAWGRALVQLGRLDEAAQKLEGALQVKPDYVPALKELATLDAAFAQAGLFDKASKTAERLRDLARAAGQKEIAEAAETRLSLYRKGQVFRQ
jgi:tetratricopeptide (TPR) repeat protein